MMAGLRRFLFFLSRLIWVICAGYLWLLWLASIPRFLQRAATSALPATMIGDVPLSQLAAAGASSWGVSLATWSVIHVLFTGLSFLVVSLIALLIWWRVRSGFGLLTAFVLLGASAYTNMAIYGAELSAVATAIWDLGVLVWPFFILWLYLFPDGQAVPRWLLWIVVPVLSLMSLYLLLDTLTALIGNSAAAAQIIATIEPMGVILPPLILLIIGAQVYRYSKISGPVQRKQTKWFLFGLIILFVPTMLLDLFTDYPPELDTITFMALPVGIGISILRYHLWEIDLIIRKTIVYSLLTAVLALVYFGIVVILQTVVGQATGEESPLVIVVSTLAIAVLFNPVRHRIQDVIDRRFYRRKVDAQHVLAQFALTARDETDVAALAAEMMHVVQETMQPAAAELWLTTKTGNPRTLYKE